MKGDVLCIKCVAGVKGDVTHQEEGSATETAKTAFASEENEFDGARNREKAVAVILVSKWHSFSLPFFENKHMHV